MADIEVRTNLPDFRRQLQALGQDFERRVGRAATNAAAQAFKKAAIGFAPVRTGLLKRAIYVKRLKARRGEEHYKVSFKQGRKARTTKVHKGFTGNLDAFYGRFLEYGWVPRGPGKKLRGGRRFQALQRSRSSSQKITKYRFIKPAFRAAKDQALKAFFSRIEKRIEQENRKKT